MMRKNDHSTSMQQQFDTSPNDFTPRRPIALQQQFNTSPLIAIPLGHV